MFFSSIEFTEKMRERIKTIEEKSCGIFTFIEAIFLPCFGNAILRFDINQENYTLSDLDTYEAFMQSIVQDAFLVDFMGSVYQKVGFEPWMYDEKFRKCYHTYMDIPITLSDYYEALNEDAALLLERCGLSPTQKVWEIQPDEDISIFVLGDENRRIGTYTFENGIIHAYEIEEIPCIGLMRAIMYAKKQHISMVRVLLEA